MESGDALRDALRTADWEALLPNLVAFASSALRRAGWKAGRDEEPSRMSVEQLVNTAIEHCLDGSRKWNPDAVDLPGFLRGVIRSLLSAAKRFDATHRVLAASDADIERAAAPDGSPEEELLAEERQRELLDGFEDCIRGDPELLALYAVILEGTTKREEIAAALGWSADRVSVVKKKLQRRFLRRGSQDARARGELDFATRRRARRASHDEGIRR